MNSNSHQETDIRNDLRTLADKIKNAAKTGDIINEELYEETKQHGSIGCPKCNYTGMIETSPGSGVYEYCECLEKQMLKTKMKNAGLRDVYSDIDSINNKDIRAYRITLKKDSKGRIIKDSNGYYETVDTEIKDIDKFIDNYKDKEKLKKIRENGIDLIIEGPVGVGKTTVAHIIGKYALQEGYSVLFIEVELLRKIWLKRDDALTEGERNIKNFITGVDFLILDDLGEEYNSGNVSFTMSLDLILRTRKSQKLVTIITTNLQEQSKDEEDTGEVTLENRYKDRISSLLKQKRIYIVLTRETDIREEQDDITKFMFE